MQGNKAVKASIIALCGFLALPACSGSPVIVSTPSACSALIPQSWAQPVPGAPLPDGNTVGDWVAFGDLQTAQLDRANGRQADTLSIIGNCEARDAKAVKQSRPKVLGLF